MSAKIQKFQQCQSFIRYHSKFKLRCQLPARHPKMAQGRAVPHLEERREAMKGKIWKDERYPDYGISGPDSPQDERVIEIPDDLHARWQKVNAGYSAVQQELKKLYEATP